jgi:hypothetical protein
LIPAAEAYLKDINLDFKVLLKSSKRFISPKCESDFSATQHHISHPAHRRYHCDIQSILHQENLDDNSALTLTMVWESFTILDCVNIVAAAKEEVRKYTLNGFWRKI